MSLVGAALFLSACSGSFDTDFGGLFKEEVPPPCPRVTILPNADTITVFREGPGRDLVDVEFEGVLEPVSGECIYENEYTEITVSLILRIGGIKGPAATGQVQDFPFFVAIADDTRKILNKEIFVSPVEIPAGKRRGAVQEELEQFIPLAPGTSGADYTIIVGFQLNEDQLRYNINTAE